MTSNDDERLEALQERVDSHGFHRVIGYTLEEVGDDWARGSVPHTQEFVNPPTEKVMHGGISATVLDATMGYAIMSALYGNPERKIGPTINLNVNYISTADEPLETFGKIEYLSSTVAFVEGTVEGAETGKVVATGQGVWLTFGP